jgi:lipopolysaccharide export system permease protein
VEGPAAVSGRRLKVGGHVDRYVSSLFLGGYATAFLLVVGLFLILDMASHLDDYLETWPDGTRAPVILLVRYYLLTVPFVFLQLAPFVTLVAGMFTVSRLLKHNEAIACLAAGVSAYRLVAPVLLGGVIVAGSMFGLRELLSAPLLDGASIANKRDALLFVLVEQRYDRVYKDLFLRDLQGSVVHIDEFRPSVGDPPVAEARGLEATINSSTDFISIEADRAVFVKDEHGEGWKLEGGRRKETRGNQTVREVDRLEGFPFTPRLALSFYRARERPLELSFAEARELARRDPDSVIYQTLLQYHLTFPLANLVLLLVGLPLLMRYERGSGLEGLAEGCLLCVFYFSADFVFRNLGIGGNIDPKLASWLPVLFFGSLGIVLFDSMRT